MRQIKLLTLLYLLSLSTLAFSGCNLTQQQRAAQAVKTEALSVNAALDLYVAAYRAGKISPENHQKVSDAYFKYHASVIAQINAVQTNSTAATPPNIAALATQLVSIITPLIK